MKKFRWFLLRLNGPFQDALQKLQSRNFGDKQSFGFLISSPGKQSDRVSFRYLKRSFVRVTVLSDEGVAQPRDVETVEEHLLEISEVSRAVYLRVDNPPRSLRDLLSDLETALGLGISITPLVFPLELQRRAIRGADAMRMVAFKGVGSSVEHKALFRFEVASKEGIEPERLDFLTQMNFKVEQSTFEVTKDMLRGQVSFASTGLVRIAGPLQPYLLGAVEREVKRAAKAAQNA